MSILGRLLGTAERTARGSAYGRSSARRPSRGRVAPRRRGYGRRTPTTAAGGISRLVGGFLRRR